MSLSLALDAALSGLMTAQRQSALVSRNIANATTPGYVRKDAQLASLVLDGSGHGVYVAGISRSVDASLQRDSRRESGLATELQTKASALQSLTTAIGQPDEERSISNQITALINAFKALGESPENTVVQQSVVGAAQNVAHTLNSMSAEIKRQRELADADIAHSVATVNTALQNIAELNKQIALHSNAGQDTTELEDQRDAQLDVLSNEMGITYFTRGQSDLVVMTEGGTTLVDGVTVHPLSFTPVSQIVPELTYNPGIGGLSGITVDGQDIAPGSGYAGAIRSGRLAALFEIRDTTMPQAQAQIDQIASALADGFQRVDATVTAAGMTGLFTNGGLAHDNTDPAQVIGLAARITVNSLVVPEQGGSLWRIRTGMNATAPGDPGDQTQIRAFQDLFNESVAFNPAAGLAASATIGDYATQFVGFQGNQRAAVDDLSRYQSTISDTLKTQRLDVEGVNVDDEMQKMLLIEQSYAASAKVIEAVRDMLDKLLEI
jgi:flagellar hook-associated protein 1 FlgK